MGAKRGCVLGGGGHSSSSGEEEDAERTSRGTIYYRPRGGHCCGKRAGGVKTT